MLTRLLSFVVLSLLSSAVMAQVWSGPGWGLRWQPNPPQELVQGYRVYIQQNDPLIINETDIGNRTTIAFTELNLTQGRYEAYVTAYNPAGESEASNVVPFVYVTSAPGEPNGLSAPTGLELIRIAQ